MIENTSNCLFRNAEKNWNSDITISTKIESIKITVCQSCRKTKTILDMSRNISEIFFKRKEDHAE